MAGQLSKVNETYFRKKTLKEYFWFIFPEILIWNRLFQKSWQYQKMHFRSSYFWYSIIETPSTLKYQLSWSYFWHFIKYPHFPYILFFCCMLLSYTLRPRKQRIVKSFIFLLRIFSDKKLLQRLLLMLLIFFL